MQDSFLGYELMLKAETFTAHPHDQMVDKIVHYSSSVGAAIYDLCESLIAEDGDTLVLYGSEGSGVSTTLHAVVRGKRDTLGCRGLVLEAEAASTGNDWAQVFKKQILGENWERQSNSDVAHKLLLLMTTPIAKFNSLAGFFSFRTIPKSYDPNAFKNDQITLHSFGAKTACLDNTFHVLGIDNFDFQGGRENDDNKDAFDLLEKLVMKAKHLNVTIIIGTHNKHILNDAKLKEMKSFKPCLASIAPNEEAPAGTYENKYSYLADQRSEGTYKIIDNLRLDCARKKYLLQRIFKGQDGAAALEEAAALDSLKDAIIGMKKKGFSQQRNTSPTVGPPANREAFLSEISDTSFPGYYMNRLYEYTVPSSPSADAKQDDQPIGNSTSLSSASESGSPTPWWPW